MTFSFSIDQNITIEKLERPIYITSETSNWADSVLKTLSLDQKIGQLFMVAGNDKNLNSGTLNYY